MKEMKREDRKQLLANIKSIAAAAATLEEIALKLDFKDEAEFVSFLSKDKEAHKIWQQARLDMWIKAKTAITTAAQQGKVEAIKALDRLYAADKSKVRETVTGLVLAKIIGKSYQTVNVWTRKNGLPRQADGTYNVKEFFAWFEKYKIAEGKKQVSAKKGEDELRGLKSKKLKMELDRERATLLLREEVLAAIVVRIQRLVVSFHRVMDIAVEVEGKSVDQIEIILTRYFEKIIDNQKDHYSELKLSKKVLKKFLEVLVDVEKTEKTSKTS